MTKLLYASYLMFYTCLFLTHDFFLSYHVFLYLVVPLALAPCEFIGALKVGPLTIPRPVFSASNILQTLQPASSLIFIGTMIFGMTMVISSSITPNFSIGWFCIFSEYLVAISLFMLVTARLAINVDDFYGAFFTFFSAIITVNALINLYHYLHALSDIKLFADTRFATDFGRVPDRYYTTGAMTYATGLIAAVGLLITEGAVIRKLIATICALTLLTCLFLSQSRGPFFASLISSFVLFAFNERRRLSYLIASVALLSVFAFLFIPKIGAFAIQRGDNHRFEVWSRFSSFALERPLLGYGERLLVSLEIANGEKLGHGHNIFLSAFMRAGIIGILSLSFVYGVSLFHASVFAKNYNNATPLGLILGAAIAGLVDFDQIIFLADWQWVSFWMPLGLAVSADRKTYISRLSLQSILHLQYWPST